MRYLSGRAAALTHSFLDDESVLTVTSVSVSVFREGMAAAVFTGAATGVAGVWTASLPPKAAGPYRAVWTAVGPSIVDTDQHEMVDGFIFSIPEFRMSDPDLTAVRFPATDVKYYRETVEAEFERITGRSFTPRVRSVRVVADGSGSAWLGVLDATALVSLSVDGLALSDLTGYSVTSTGFLEALSPPSAGAVLLATVAYGFGTVPPDIRRAALLRTRYVMAAETSGIPDRATQFVAADGGQFTLATAGAGHWETGIPEVDATLARYRFDILLAVVGIA